MKILFFSSHPQLGLHHMAGYATHMRNVIDALRAEGHEVKTLIAGDAQSTEKINQQAGAVHSRSRVKKFIPPVLWETLKDIKLLRFDKRLQKTLEHEISDFDPDVVYERVNYFQLSGVRACKRKKVKHISEINSPYIEERIYLQGNTWLKRRAAQREKELFQLSDEIILVSSALKDHFTKKYPFTKNKITVVPNAINPQIVKIDQGIISDFLLKHPSVEGKKIIGFVGSIAPWHGIERLLEAATELESVRNDLIFLIVGGGQLLNEYRNKAVTLGISEKIIWTDSVPFGDVFSYIQLMDITVMPDSNWYGSPIKIFEYALLEKPIIAPDYIPLRDVMDPNKDGVLISTDKCALSKAILMLADNELLCKELGRSFHDKVLLNFTWKTVARTIIEKATAL